MIFLLFEFAMLTKIGKALGLKGSGLDSRILIYAINYAPELTGIGKYTGEMAAWLAAQGHDVRMVTAPP